MESLYTITEYSLWRRVDQYKSSRPDGEIVSTSEGSPYGRLAYPPGEWDFVKTVPARYESTYSTICPTLADSTVVEGMFWSVFFVSAMTADPSVYFDSEPDSGYSVDNLPPAPPRGLAGQSGDAEDTLWWSANLEEDLWYYAIYRRIGGVPDTSDWIANIQDTTYIDRGLINDSTYFYRVCAFDLSGNRSDYSEPIQIMPTGIQSHEVVQLPSDFALFQNYPNPFNPVTEIRYDLPVDSRVNLEVYNIAGQRVATLVDGDQKAGYKTARWDASSFSSGIFLYRLRVGEYTETRRMVLLR